MILLETLRIQIKLVKAGMASPFISTANRGHFSGSMNILNQCLYACGSDKSIQSQLARTIDNDELLFVGKVCSIDTPGTYNRKSVELYTAHTVDMKINRWTFFFMLAKLAGMRKGKTIVLATLLFPFQDMIIRPASC